MQTWNLLRQLIKKAAILYLKQARNRKEKSHLSILVNFFHRKDLFNVRTVKSNRSPWGIFEKKFKTVTAIIYERVPHCSLNLFYWSI